MSSVLTSTPNKLLTAEEFYDYCCLPENDFRWLELVRGEVIELPSPTKPHGVVCLNMSWFLMSYIRGRGKGYLTGYDSGVILRRDPDTVRGPDIGYYEDAERFVDLHPKYGEVAPRAAVEVLSPNDRWSRVTAKILDYLRSGVELVWVIDPENREVTVFRPGKEPYKVCGDQDLTGEDVLPGFRVRVSDLFRLPGESVPDSTPPKMPEPPPLPPTSAPTNPPPP